MIFQKAIIALLVSALIMGCSPNEGGSIGLRDSAIKSFDRGDFSHALELAKQLRSYDKNFSKFLVSQIMTLGAMRHGGAFSNLRSYYTDASSLNFSAAPGAWRLKFFAAKIFAEIYAQGNDVALKDFTNGCVLLKNVIVESCAEDLLNGALKLYLATKTNIDRVYLSNVSYVSARLDIGGRSIADFGIAMSLIGVDDLRSKAIILNLNERGLLSERKLGLYCQFVRSVCADPDHATGISCGSGKKASKQGSECTFKSNLPALRTRVLDPRLKS